MADEHHTSLVANLVSDNSKNAYKPLDAEDSKLQYSVKALRNNPFRVSTLCLGLLCALLLAGVIGQSVHYSKSEQEKQNKLTALINDKADLQERLKAEQELKRNAEIYRTQTMEKSAELTKKREQLYSSNHKLNEESNKLKVSQKKLQENNDALNRSTEQLKDSNDLLQNANSLLSKDKDSLQKQYDAVFQRKNELQASYDLVTKERDNLQNKVNNVSRAKDVLQTSYNSMWKDVECLQKRYNSSVSEKEKVETRHLNLTAERAMLLTTTDIIKKSIAELEKNYETYVREQRDLEVKCDAEIKEGQRLKAANNNLTAETEQLREEVKTLNSTLKGENCPNGWGRFENSCFFTSVLMKSWAEAREHCKSMKADLAIIKTQEKMTFINGLYGSSKEVWIGLTDNGNEGQWNWVDGTPMTTPFWAAGQPNSHQGKDQDCVEFWHRGSGNGEWNDEACDLRQCFICEKTATTQ